MCDNEVSNTQLHKENTMSDQEKSKGNEKQLEGELRDSLRDGALVNAKSGGLDGLRASLKKQVEGDTPEFLATKTAFAEKVAELIWDKHALKLLKGYVREGVDLTPLYKQLNYIPKDMIDAKAKNTRGVTPAGSKQKNSTLFEAGIGRIVTDGEVELVQKKIGVFKLQNYGLNNPFKIDVKNPNDFRVLFVNGPHMGLEYNRVIDENPLRNVFRHAKRMNADAIVITAGLMWMDTKKSSGRLTTHRALYSGLDFDPAVIDPEYRAEAVAIRNNPPANKISFITRREKVMNAFGGWRKVTEHKNGSPIVGDIPVYIVFGYPEEEMIETAAHEHLRYLKTCMELEARAKRKAAEAELAYAFANHDKAEINRLRKEADRLLRLEKRKSANTNIDPADHRRFVGVIRTLLISWYEKAIPNAKFVSQGAVTFDIGGRKVDLLQATHDRPAEDDMSHIIRSVGQRDLDGTLPDVILGAGAYNLLARWSARMCMRGTEDDQVQIWQLPVLINRDYLREAKAELLHKGSPIEKLVSDGTFVPGAFVLSM